MAHPKAAWGIEIGAFAIKAIRLERTDTGVHVADFASIPHRRVLTTPDLDQDEMIRLSLGQFISQKSLEGEHLVMSVPGHTAFARFAKLPPVEPKKVPDIVKFEAVQQIPFPIDEVEWDYETFQIEGTPELEVGIFAITREKAQERLQLYGELGLSPEAMILSPVALYNAMAYDHGLLEKRRSPVVYIDIGTQATDMVIAEQGRCWIRTFPLGGTHFTEAIAKAFKIDYAKAEKLKREAATSRYAKQIMQAMRPVFTELLQDLQRSLGYYQNVHREHKLESMIGVGSTFKIPGLRKFIGQQLQVNVSRLDEYRKISVEGREAAAFAETSVTMGTAYGLALQGVGLASIAANLVPVSVLREQLWHSKTKWFAAAAAIIIAGSAASLWHPLHDRSLLSPGGSPAIVRSVLDQGERSRKAYEQARLEGSIGHLAENLRGLFDYRTVWPWIVQDVAASLRSTDPQAELLAGDLDTILGVSPGERRLVQLMRLDGDYLPPDESREQPRIAVTMEVELSRRNGIEFLNRTVATWLRSHAEPGGDRAEAPYRILLDTISLNPELIVSTEVTETESTAASPQRAGGGTPRQGGGNRRTGGGGGPQGGGTRRTGGGGGGRLTGGDVALDPEGPPGGALTGGDPRDAEPGADEGGFSAGGETLDIESMAPLPERPRTYPVGTTYIRVPITFEVEILPVRGGTTSVRGRGHPGEMPS